MSLAAPARAGSSRAPRAPGAESRVGLARRTAAPARRFVLASRKAFTEFEKVIADAVKEVPELKQQLGDGDMIAKMSEEMKKKEPKIGEEKIDGEKATLKMTVDETEESIPFVREKDAWKMKLTGKIPTPEKMREMITMMKAMIKSMKEKAKEEQAPK